jgi:hypothetical protein
MSVKSSSVSRIVARFGGQNAMARATGIAQGTIWGWTKSGRIPQDRWSTIRAAARRLPAPVELTPADFVDLEDEPAQVAA